MLARRHKLLLRYVVGVVENGETIRLKGILPARNGQVELECGHLLERAEFEENYQRGVTQCYCPRCGEIPHSVTNPQAEAACR